MPLTVDFFCFRGRISVRASRETIHIFVLTSSVQEGEKFIFKVLNGIPEIEKFFQYEYFLCSSSSNRLLAFTIYVVIQYMKYRLENLAFNSNHDFFIFSALARPDVNTFAEPDATFLKEV